MQQPILSNTSLILCYFVQLGIASKAIAEQCFYEFIRQIKYKSKFNGIEFIQADRFYPSSKKCSCCVQCKERFKTKRKNLYL
ncbi:MAG: zinc ribbon domain-containing protein [Lachnoclostridium sp.]